MFKVGIDSISSYIPKLYLDLTGKWAEVRAVEQGLDSVEKLLGKIKKGIGVEKMAIPDFHEDSATMAAMAVKKLITENDIDLNDVATITVGTETTVDQSKSMAAYVLGMLEDWAGKRYTHIGCPQVQFACIGATYGLEASLNALKADSLGKKYAIVVATDIAKYSLRSPGECTQGAGAVAMLLSKNPRLIELDPALFGTATFNERDFYRPNYSKSAVVDGKYSIDVYLECMEEALKNYMERTSESAESLYSKLDHLLFHLPFPRMAEYAAARIFSTLWPKIERFKAVAKELGLSNPANLVRSDRKGLERDLTKHPLFREEFSQKILPSLVLSRDIGNIYSGSLYLACMSLIDSSNRENVDLSNREVLFISYGSGASAKVFSGKIGKLYKEVMPGYAFSDSLRVREEDGLRTPVSMEQYELLHRGSEISVVEQKLENSFGVASLNPQIPLSSKFISVLQPKESIQKPENEFVLERVGCSESKEIVDIGYRYYKWVGEPVD